MFEATVGSGPAVGARPLDARLRTCSCSCGDVHPAVPLRAVPTVEEVLQRGRQVAQERARRQAELGPPPRWEERHPVAARLADTAPSAGLARELGELVPGDCDDPALVEVVAAWERVVSWATAGQASAVAEMVRRAGGPREEGFVADEIAAVTGVTPRAGRVLVERAVALMRASEVHDALADGTLTVRKADTLCRATAHLPPGQAAIVHDAVLAHGSGLTAPQIRATARRVELELDPTAADRRHETARRTRSVWMEPAEDCMAFVHAYLPASDAMRVMTAVDAVAATAGPDDDRGIDARRADALVDMLRRVLDRGVGPDGVDLPVSPRRRPHLNVTLNLSTLLGLRDDPAVLAGYGPIGARMAREVAAQGAWTFTMVDPRTGEVLQRASKGYRPSPTVLQAVLDRTPTCTFPGCGVAASWCDIDHITPYDHDRPDEEQTRTDRLHPLCRHHHVMKTHGRWTPTRDAATGVTTWQSRTGQVYTRDPVAAPFEPGPPGRCDAEGGPPPRETPTSPQPGSPPTSETHSRTTETNSPPTREPDSSSIREPDSSSTRDACSSPTPAPDFPAATATPGREPTPGGMPGPADERGATGCTAEGEGPPGPDGDPPF